MPLRSAPLLLAALLPALAAGQAPPAEDAESLRRFLDEEPALLLAADARARLAAAPVEERRAFVAEFLGRDPLPETPVNELVLGIERRRRLLAAERLSPFDDRGRLLFLHGAPAERLEVECAETYRALELWRWGAAPAARWAVLYRPGVGRHHRLWRPTDSKRVLYTEEIEYLLEQFEELRGRLRPGVKRPDRLFCKQSEQVDEITGVSGLFGFAVQRMTDAQAEALLAPPADLAAWARAAAATPAAAAAELPTPELTVSFPARIGQRLVTRFRFDLPAGVELAAVESGGGREVRLALAGVLDRAEGSFEEFRLRFLFAPPAPGTPVVLLAERALRPHERFVARFELRDETSDRRAWVARAIEVPAEPAPEHAATPPGAVLGAEAGLTREGGRDSLILLPPAADVVLGLFRADAMVVGERIRKVVFSLDGKPQLTRTTPPWSAELRLPLIPREVVVRAEGLDVEGKVVAADEVLINEPQGEPRVRLLEPPRGARVEGRVRVRAAVVAPEGRRVESVQFELNDEPVATLTQPPWETVVEVPSAATLAYLTVTAVYQDGTRVEDFRVLNATEFVEEIEVDLVELYATVTDRGGGLVEGLAASDFEVLDNGRPQRIAEFELVRDLPLTVGLLLDLSGSMRESLVEAKRAATGFLAGVVTPRDRCFAVGFSERPMLLMPLTSDARAIEIAFRDLPALGNTSLHDALVYGLYQFRGVRGRKAMVLLSDGDDTSSLVRWEQALEYAQRSGVAVYTVGLDIGRGSLGIREKLEDLAEETGGRTFFVGQAAELAGVYERIEEELRRQYLIAFAPDPPPGAGERHAVEIRARDRSLRVRAAKGYTP